MDALHRPPSILKSLLIMFAFVLVCLVSIVVVADQSCRSSIDEWAPLYPGADVVSMDHNGFRPRALGSTVAILSTTDDAEIAREFYRQNTLRVLRAEISRGLASTNWAVTPNPDGSGGLITLWSECGQ